MDPINLDIAVSVDVDSQLALAHAHDDTFVPLVQIDEQRDDDEPNQPPARTLHRTVRTYECPQCQTRIGFELETTVDTHVQSEPGVRTSVVVRPR